MLYSSLGLSQFNVVGSVASILIGLVFVGD